IGGRAQAWPQLERSHQERLMGACRPGIDVSERGRTQAEEGEGAALEEEAAHWTHGRRVAARIYFFLICHGVPRVYAILESNGTGSAVVYVKINVASGHRLTPEC
ncbi:MAG: hypothetical protein WA642_12125, partial [Steroidobacteraceae bacterium]